MNRTCDTLYGEPIRDVLPGLMALANSMEPAADGMYEGSVRLEASVAAPLFRALMRAEAELMLEDADSFGSMDGHGRTYEQRAADAILRLVSRLGENRR